MYLNYKTLPITAPKKSYFEGLRYSSVRIKQAYLQQIKDMDINIDIILQEIIEKSQNQALMTRLDWVGSSVVLSMPYIRGEMGSNYDLLGSIILQVLQKYKINI